MKNEQPPPPAHSPLPWSKDERPLNGVVFIYNAKSRPIVECEDDDARLIVHRVNAHAGLVEALEEARMQIEYLHDKFQTTSTGVATLARIDAALAQAKEENV